MQARLLNIDTVILTPRTVTRRFRENEGILLYDLIQDNHSFLVDAFVKFLKETETKEKAEFFLRERIVGWLLQNEYCFGLWDNESAKLIGMIRFFRIDWSVPKAELGFFIDHQYGGKGIMSEVLTTCLHFGFQQLQMERIYLRTATDNFACQRLARKCGFRREGDLRSDFKKMSGELLDVMIFGVTRAEYEKA
ncbi:MAG: hypothetical protein DHS20C18_43930 [Saprospiraceae bacterium]|nr:MAG: hypothetical protein DHS20C18_43930 [Saprospiraceae bacterium]